MRTIYPSIQKFCVLLLVLSCLLRGLFMYKTHQQQMERFHGWLTPQQILTRSESICHAVAPQFDTFKLTLEPSSFVGDAHQFVLCTDPEGHELVHLTWNARKGQILDVSCTSLCHTWYPNMHVAVISNPHQALDSADAWIHLLNLGGPGNNWQLAQPPKAGFNHHWGVCCISGKKRVFFYIDGYCGSLITVFLG